MLLCQNSTIFDFFYISQGNVATYVRCGGNTDKGFITNFLLKLMVKEFWNLAKL